MISLRLIEKEDNDRLREWRNNPIIANRFFSQDFISKDKQEEWFNKSTNSKKELNWIISLTHMIYGDYFIYKIGTIALIDIDMRNRKAEYARLLIDPSFRRKGYAYEAEQLVMNYGFNYLNLNKIYCYDYKDNHEVNNLHYKTGFRMAGEFKNHIFRDGKYEDVIILELMRNEWIEKRNG